MSPISCSACCDAAPPRVRRLDQRRRRFLPHRALPRVQVHPRKARRGTAGRFRHGGRAGRQLLAAFRVPLVAVDGYEADDVIGTLAGQAAARGPAGGHRLGRQGFLPADRPASRPAQSRARRPRRRSKRPGSTSPTPPIGSASRLAGAGLPRAGRRQLRQRAGRQGHRRQGRAQLLEEYGDLEPSSAHAGEVSGSGPARRSSTQADQARLSLELVTIQLDVPVRVRPRRARAARARSGGARARCWPSWSSTAWRDKLGLAGAQAGSAGQR